MRGRPALKVTLAGRHGSLQHLKRPRTARPFSCSCSSGFSRELPAPSPAKAGEGWGGVSFGSSRSVATPSQPPPAVAGGGADLPRSGSRACPGAGVDRRPGPPTFASEDLAVFLVLLTAPLQAGDKVGEVGPR